VIIDCHVHVARQLTGFWQPRRYGRVVDEDDEFQAMPPSFDPPASPAELALAYMDWAGVDRAILLQHHLYGDQNEAILDAVNAWPARFSGFAYLGGFDHRDDPDRLEALLRRGMAGLKVELATTRRLRSTFAFDGAAERAVWARLDALSAPLILDINGCTTQDVVAVRHLIEAFDHLRVCICHLAGAERGEGRDGALLGLHPRVWIDLASLQRGDDEYPFPRVQDLISWAVEHIGPDRLMWGTDYPGALNWATYRQWADLVRRHCSFLSEDQRASILGGAAARFLLWQEA